MNDGRYSGIVVRGERKGSALGFPTANIPLEKNGLSGIYAAEAVVDDIRYDAAVYVNKRRSVLEAHLLDFSGDLYDRPITITLLGKIREDEALESFPDTGALMARIDGDIAAVRAYFAGDRKD